LSVAIAFMGSGAVWAIRPVEAAPLAAGFAHGDITPKVTKEKPVWIAGYGQNRPATGVHDPLFCRVVVLDDGNHKFALASVDLIGLQYPAVLKIRAQLPEFDYVLVASTHNHEGPDVIGIWGPSAFRSGVDPEYVEFVIARVVETIRQAARKTRPVRAAFGTSTDETMLRDSRLPNVVDGVLRVIYFTTLGTEEAAGILVQWNCHPEALGPENQELTADFPFATVTALEKRYTCPVVYFTGAVGGLMTTPKTIKNPGGPDLHEGNFEYAETYGRAVARLTQKGIDQAEPVSLSPLAVAARPILLPLANPLYQAGRTIGVMTREAFVWQGDSEKVGPPATSTTPLDELAIKTEVACVQLGQVRVAAIPGEVYPELVYGKFQDPADPGADFPDAPLEPAVMNVPERKRTLLFGMANDEVGYIIPKRQWDQMPPFAYGREKSQYGEISSCGPETAPILMKAWRRQVQALQGERPPDP